MFKNCFVLLFFIGSALLFFYLKKVDSTLFSLKVIEKGYIDVVEEGSVDSKGRKISIETSAVVLDNTQIVFASDKKIGNGSSIFSVNYPISDQKKVEFLLNEKIESVIKFEDFTKTLDGKYIIVTTAFNRVEKNHRYCHLLAWESGKPETTYIISETEEKGFYSSISIRNKIVKVLNPNFEPGEFLYFKIESIAVIPGNQLLFGIREEGRTNFDFEYKIKIISVSFDIVEDKIVLKDDFSLAYEMDPYSLKNQLGHIVALSSLTYDPFNDQLLLLTSFEEEGEKDESLGAFLWALPIDSFKKGEPARLFVYPKTFTPIRLSHKGEGVAFLERDKIIIVSDDDRVVGRDEKFITDEEVQFSRKPHQFYYEILDLVPINP